MQSEEPLSHSAAEHVAQMSYECADQQTEQRNDLKAGITAGLRPHFETPDRIRDEREGGCDHIGNVDIN
jgi:hypothetical protein